MEKNMNTQQQNSRLTSLPVVMFLAGICCFLWGSATPTIKTGYRLFQIQSSDAMSIILFAGMRTGGNVFISILVASLIFRYEKLTARKLVGCALGFVGIVVMNLSGQEGNLFQVSLLGEGFVLFAQIFYATSGALLKKYGNQYDVVTLSGYQFMLGGLILILIGLFGGGRVQVESGVSAYILLLYLAFISAVAYTLWGVLLKYNPVSRVTVFGFMNPVFGVLLSALVLGETAQAFSVKSLVALVFVCLGIYVVNSVKTAER